MKDQKEKKDAPWVNAVAGAASGAISAFFTSPLDVAKTRLQVQPSSADSAHLYKGTFGTLRKTFVEEGVRGWFHGLKPALFGLVPTWAVYFTVYNHVKGALVKWTGKDESLIHMASAMSAGACTNVLTNPIWVIKTRYQTQTMSGRNNIQYSGLISGYSTIGLQLRISQYALKVGTIHVGVQFPLYERLKREFAIMTNRPVDELGALSLIAASAISKMIASVVAYPHEVIRSRLQDQDASRPDKYKGVIRTTAIIVREEGVRALYKGMGTNLIRVVPSCAITFTSYELIKKYLLLINEKVP